MMSLLIAVENTASAIIDPCLIINDSLEILQRITLTSELSFLGVLSTIIPLFSDNILHDLTVKSKLVGNSNLSPVDTSFLSNGLITQIGSPASFLSISE